MRVKWPDQHKLNVLDETFRTRPVIYWLWRVYSRVLMAMAVVGMFAAPCLILGSLPLALWWLRSSLFPEETQNTWFAVFTTIGFVLLALITWLFARTAWNHMRRTDDIDVGRIAGLMGVACSIVVYLWVAQSLLAGTW